jgi:hypothetical protein
MFLIRVTHSSGMLEGKYTAEPSFRRLIIAAIDRGAGC